MALLVVLVAAIVITLAGGAYLVMSSAESRIARNETVSLQARYAAEAAARAVRAWFDRPGTAPGFPQDPALVSRERRLADGAPEYKEGVDRDGDGRDDLFDRPFSGAAVHSLLGTSQNPDVRIDHPAVLDGFSRALFGEFPESGLRARVREIRVYAPPAMPESGPRPVATIRVVAGIYREGSPGWSAALAERVVSVVVSELPYTRSVRGPVHSCRDLQLSGDDPGVRWGALSAAGEIVGLLSAAGVRPSLPRGPARADGIDRLWTNDAGWVAEFSASLDPGEELPDPWLRVLAGGGIVGTPSSTEQPFAGAPPPSPGTPPHWPCCDRSNLFQNQAWIGCPDQAYGFWKSVSRSALPRVHYYAPDGVGRFVERGSDSPRTFEEVFLEAGGEPGLYFFDTADRRPPRDTDGDGAFDNLTPGIELGAEWRARGFVILHSERVLANGLVDSLAETLQAPGEPFVGVQEGWVELRYPSTLESPFFPAEAADWTSRGPGIAAGVVFRGILINRGRFDATGAGGTFYGGLVAHGVGLDGSTPPSTRFFWDADLAGSWPPDGWELPRVIVTRVEYD